MDVTSGVVVEQLPPAVVAPAQAAVDPGCLPAWGVGELPEPKPFTWRNWLSLIGPGLVLAGGSIGTGEWVMGPKIAALYHGAFMWAVLCSIVGQVIFNTEAMRYTLVTGEPIFTGFLRTRPGPKFWLIVYLLLDVGSWWPAQAGLAAQILVVWVTRLSPADQIDPDTVRNVSYAVFLVCAAVALVGGKIYNTLTAVSGGKFLFTLAYLSFCCLFFVSMKTWGEVWSGLFDVTRVPRDAAGNPAVDWALFSALVGYTGVGGLQNVLASNYARERGWGMGSKVGAIPSAVGGHKIHLSHVGIMPPDTAPSAQRFRGWYRYLIPDQYVVWAVGSLVAMLLPCMLGAEFLNARSLNAKEEWKWAAALAQDFGAARGQIFRHLTLLCGLVIMVPGQFVTADATARRWTDAVWSGLQSVRKIDTGKVKYVYYSFAGLYVAFGIWAYTFFPKMTATTMMIIAGSMANLALAAAMFHTLYVNVRFLPRGMRPSAGKRTALVVAGLFFLVVFALVANQKLRPLLGW